MTICSKIQVYGASSDADYIESKKQCLTVEKNELAKKIKELAVDIKIYKTPGSHSVRRKNITTIETIESENPAAPVAQQQTSSGSSGGSRRRRNRPDRSEFLF